jgi:hypothetical protein
MCGARCPFDATSCFEGEILNIVVLHHELLEFFQRLHIEPLELLDQPVETPRAFWRPAEALMIYRTLDAAMIDTIIASAPERGRRADWSEVLKNSAEFAAGLES